MLLKWSKEGDPPRLDTVRVDAATRTVGEIASRTLLTCPPSTPVAEAATMMRRANYSSVIVVEDGRPAGIWTERDALRLDYSRPETFTQPIAAVMTTPVRSIGMDESIGAAGVRFKRERVRHLLVVDGEGRPFGMVSQTDLILNHGVEQYLTFRDVCSVMAPNPLLLAASTPLPEAANLIHEHDADAAIVLAEDGGEPGMITERDLVRITSEARHCACVGDVASRPLVAVPPQATLLAARNLFAQHGIRHLAVRRDDGVFIGLLSFSDILTNIQYEYVAQLGRVIRERDDALIRSRKDLLLARQVIDASAEGVMIVDEQGVIEYVNAAFCRVTGYSAEEAVGRNPRFLQSGQQDQEFYARMWDDLLTHGHWRGEIWNRRKNGEVYAEWLSINAIRDEDGAIAKFAAIFSDISDRKRHEERVRNLAYVDALTGLPNRRLLTDRLSLAIANAHRHGVPFAVMFLDLDLFKRVNDTLGHKAGDEVLVETARRLQTCMRDGDTVARFGGDEFVILLAELDDAADAGRIAERAIDAIRAPLSIGGRSIFVTTSIGIAVFPDDGNDADTLLRSADLAMYQAKQIGRNGFQVHSRTINARSHERIAVENSLRHALAADEFRLAYQVKVDMATGRMSGAEALLRWNHPELGLVPPAEFLPIAERMGLMPSLGAWVICNACRQNRIWRERGLPAIRMSVNVSPHQLRSPNFAEVVLAALTENGLKPEHLELEITENLLLDDTRAVVAVLERLNAAGISISIDDFGSRHSSLSALRSLPISALKIDRGFIAGLGGAAHETEIINAVVGLAHALGMKAIAEGVETIEQARVLRQAGCDEIQGYLVSRAVSPADLESLFDRHLLPGI